MSIHLARQAAMRSTYHHGNARAALLEAGLKLLEVTPATSLALRQVAEAAGLSRQAPYNHFGDKEGLLAALAEAGFDALAAALDAALAETATPAAALEALARGYIGFAHASPQRFRLMFQRELVDIARFPAAATASARAYARIADVIESIAAPAAAGDLAVAAWSLVHGYATLLIETGFEPEAAIAARARQFAGVILARAVG